MGCGDSGCHGPSMAYEAAADISSRTSSKEVLVIANLTAIHDLLSQQVADTEEAVAEAEEELSRQQAKLEHLREAVYEVRQAQAA